MEKSFTEFFLSQNPISRPLYLSDLATAAMSGLGPQTTPPQLHPALFHWAKLLRQRADLQQPPNFSHCLSPLNSPTAAAGGGVVPVPPQHFPLALTINPSPYPTFAGSATANSSNFSPKKTCTPKTSAFSPISPKSPGSEFYYYPQHQSQHLQHQEQLMGPLPLLSPVHPQDLRLQLKIQQLLHSPAYPHFIEQLQQHAAGNVQFGKSSPNSPRYPGTRSHAQTQPDVDGLLDLSIKSATTTPMKSPQVPLSPKDYAGSPMGRKRTLQETLDLSSRKVSPVLSQRHEKQNVRIIHLLSYFYDFNFLNYSPYNFQNNFQVKLLFSKWFSFPLSR